MIERNKPAVSPLIYWATERESIRVKKAQGLPPPWTDDPFLQKYRFCNVMRKHDRVSQWMVSNVLQYQAEFDDLMVFIKWVALCRWVNWPPTLEGIICDNGLIAHDQIDLQGIGNYIEELISEGDKAWTGAYMVRAPSKAKFPNTSKGKFVAEIVVGALDTVSEQLLYTINEKCSRAVWSVICSVPNWGSFMAGQLVADLTYTDLLGDAYDLYTWAPQGPGSRRGFNRLLGRPLKQKIEETEWLEHLKEWHRQVAEATGLPLNLMDLQNCLCETDKYLRVKAGEGRPRSTYRPETAYYV